MSETIPQEAAETPAEQTPLDAETPVSETQTQEAQAGEPEPDPKPKKNVDRRFAALTAKASEQRAELEMVKRERDAALALANAGKDPQPNPQGDIEAAAHRLVAQREAQTKLSSVVTKGQQEYADWGPKTDVLAGLGATDNPAFMEALVEMPNATKIVAHLSDDPDALASLLGKSPTAMAAAMGRLDAELGRPAPRSLSNAPRPVQPITTPAVVPEPDAYDEKLTMAEYVKLRNKMAPRHLGGLRR